MIDGGANEEDAQDAIDHIRAAYMVSVLCRRMPDRSLEQVVWWHRAAFTIRMNWTWWHPTAQSWPLPHPRAQTPEKPEAAKAARFVGAGCLPSSAATKARCCCDRAFKISVGGDEMCKEDPNGGADVLGIRG